MISVYFQHETLTPGNVREVWYDAQAVPRVGDFVGLHCGYMDQRVVWQVIRVEWLAARAVTCTMSGDDRRAEWEAREAESSAGLVDAIVSAVTR